MKGLSAAYQFDPNISPYPLEWEAFCHGPGSFFAATPHGLVPMSKGDWVLVFENGDRVVIRNDTYQQYFKAPPELPATEAGSSIEVEDSPKAERPRRARSVARENPEPGEPGDAA